MKFGQVEEELEASANGRDGTMDPLGSFAQHRREEWICCGRVRGLHQLSGVTLKEKQGS